mgnify:CR=1 FL=1|jgi:hypothetical protein
MKIIQVILIAVILSLSFNFQTVLAETKSTEEAQKDVILTLIAGNLNDAIVGHYGEYRNFHLFSVQILEFERIRKFKYLLGKNQQINRVWTR